MCVCVCAAAGEDRERSDAVAVGTWGMDAIILQLPSLKPLFQEALPTDVIPRRWAGGAGEGPQAHSCTAAAAPC